MNAPALRTRSQIARPLKVLIPLIQSELSEANAAGHEHYRRAGQMLIEAKEQVPYGGWGRWLTKNFELSQPTARVYMRWAREQQSHFDSGAIEPAYTSLREMTGQTEWRREQSRAEQHQQFRRTLREVARDDFAQERQRIEAEVALHRKLAEELVDLGFRALATRLHPDRGGSQDAMTRLNRVRDELKQVAQTRRFVS